MKCRKTVGQTLALDAKILNHQFRTKEVLLCVALFLKGLAAIAESWFSYLHSIFYVQPNCNSCKSQLLL
jgi:hypothetical protein